MSDTNYRKTIGLEACRRYRDEQPHATAIEMFAWIESQAIAAYCGWSDADIDDMSIAGTRDLSPAQREEIMELFASRFDGSIGIGNEDLREAILNVTGLGDPDEEGED
jgi:hypothetical protein